MSRFHTTKVDINFVLQQISERLKDKQELAFLSLEKLEVEDNVRGVRMQSPSFDILFTPQVNEDGSMCIAAYHVVEFNELDEMSDQELVFEIWENPTGSPEAMEKLKERGWTEDRIYDQTARLQDPHFHLWRIHLFPGDVSRRNWKELSRRGWSDDKILSEVQKLKGSDNS